LERERIFPPSHTQPATEHLAFLSSILPGSAAAALFWIALLFSFQMSSCHDLRIFYAWLRKNTTLCKAIDSSEIHKYIGMPSSDFLEGITRISTVLRTTKTPKLVILQGMKARVIFASTQITAPLLWR
jgi:hypothetical protein